MVLLYFEIFEEFEKANTKEGKINVLRKYNSPNFRLFFSYFFDPEVKFFNDIPKYKPAEEPEGMNWTTIEMEVPKLYRFMKGNPIAEKLTDKRRKELLTILLESLHAKEAKILINLFNKDLKIKYLTPNIVKEALGAVLL